MDQVIVQIVSEPKIWFTVSSVALLLTRILSRMCSNTAMKDKLTQGAMQEICFEIVNGEISFL